ncbi:hypothetical protein HZH66_014901 [Vespula vulgaris]|uniref:Uncharacterized protein n=1 Tax=Vespula vulgaris TaxID=7454 RepID=A0A834MNJ5_VESVU|nr:hypothetical protein HZH66_014901 [Vespula vulgaris]
MTNNKAIGRRGYRYPTIVQTPAKSLEEHPLMYTTLLTGVKTLVAGDRYYEDKDDDDDDDDDEEDNMDVRERGVPVMTKARTSQSVRGSTFGHQAEYSNRAPSWSSIYPFAYQEPTACCSLCPCPSEIYCPKYPELS